MKKIVLLLLGCYCMAAMGQNLISPITISLPANPSSNTADWATAIPSFTIIAQSKLRNGQVPGEVIESRVLVTIKGGSKIYGSYTRQTAPQSNFNNATKTWSGINALSLLGKDFTLPPGSYELWVQFFNLNPAAGNGVLGEGFKTFIIADKKDESYSPPQNIMPAEGKSFTVQEVQMPLTFRWTPVLPRPKEDIIYKVRLLEIRSGQTKMQALKTNTPVQEAEVKNTTQTTFKLAQRYNGLLWYVEAIGTERVQGSNPRSYGSSEPSTFRFAVVPTVASAACTNVTVAETTTCQGTSAANNLTIYGSVPKITNNSGLQITSWTVTTTQATLYSGTAPVTVYQGTPAVINTGVTLTAAPVFFASPAPMPIFFTYTFNFANGTQCEVVKTVDYPPSCTAAASCNCAAWPGTISYSLGYNSNTSSGTVANNGTITLTNNEYLNLGNIQAPCAASGCLGNVQYSLYGPNNVFIPIGTAGVFDAGSLQEQPCSNAGKYKIVIKAQCGVNQCSDFIIWVDKPCPAGVCNPQWEGKGVIVPGQPELLEGTVFNMSCDTTLNINQNDKFAVFGFKQCTSGNTTNYLKITAPDGTIVSNVSSTTDAALDSVIATQCGTYKAQVFTQCGTVFCDTCTYFIHVNCGFNCNCLSIKQALVCLGGHTALADTITNTCNKNITSWTVTINGGATIVGTPTPQSINAGTTIIDPIILTNIVPGNSVLTYTFTFADGTTCVINKNLTLFNTCPVVSCPVCTPTITIQSGGQPAVTLSATTPISLNCNQSYSIAKLLNCVPADATIDFNNFWLLDFTLNPANIVPWAAGFNGSGVLNIPANVSGTYYLRYRWGSSTLNCAFVTYQLNINCVAPCSCGTWQSAKYRKNGVTQGLVSCGNTTPFAVPLNVPVGFSSGINCNPNNGSCIATGNYRIYKGLTLIVPPTSGFIANYTFTSCGDYQIVFKGSCGTTACLDSCIINVNVPCCPAAPNVVSTVSYCQNSTAAALTATGTNLLWYTTATGGTGSAVAPVPSTATPGTTTYYVTQTVSGCESDRASVIVIVNAAPPAPLVLSQYYYCQNTVPGLLYATGISLRWYTSLTGTGSSVAPIISTANVGVTSYWVTQTVNGCESPKTQVDVVVKAIPPPPVVPAVIPYCQNGVALPLTATGSNLLWYTSSTGGTGTTTAPIPSTASTGTFYYYVTQTVNGCESPRRQVTVTVSICCTCGKWDPIGYSYINAGGGNPIPGGKLVCGGVITAQQNSQYTFSTNLTCAPAGNCKPGSKKYSIYKDGSLIYGPAVITGSSFTFTYTFDKCGDYKIVFEATCGTNVCKCSIGVNIDCCGGGKIVMFNSLGVPLPNPNACVTGGTTYSFKLSNPLPPGISQGINYQLFELPGTSGTPIQSGTFTYNPLTGLNLNVPFPSCTVKRFRIIFSWNNGICKDTLERDICTPNCCDYIDAGVPQLQTKTLTGTPLNRSLNFVSAFTLHNGSPVNFSKIKIQILGLSVNNLPVPNANLSQVKIVAPFILNSSLVNFNAVVAGDAIWFNYLILTSQMPISTLPNTLVFNGSIINLGAIPPGASVRLKLRYTFFRNVSPCQPAKTICEKEIIYN